MIFTLRNFASFAVKMLGFDLPQSQRSAHGRHM